MDSTQVKWQEVKRPTPRSNGILNLEPRDCLSE